MKPLPYRTMLFAITALAWPLGCGGGSSSSTSRDATQLPDAQASGQGGHGGRDAAATEAAMVAVPDAGPSKVKDSGPDRAADGPGSADAPTSDLASVRDGAREAAADVGTPGGADAVVVRDAGASDARVDTNLEAGNGSEVLPSVTVYLAGDSTVSTYTNSSIHQAGWGQMLAQYFNSRVKVDNRAIGGRTARRFIDEGYLDEILGDIKPGDYLLVQFGTNDGNKTATYTLNGQEIPYYLAPATDFKAYLTQYVSGAKEKKAITVFVTPPPRHSCSGTSLGVANGLSAYADAMKELGTSLDVPVVDLNGETMDYLANVACDVSGQTFFLVKADGTIDSTHFQENGAKIMAGLVADGIRDRGLSLAAYLK